MTAILVWPNTVPFNGMLLSGLLNFKSRSRPINYRGLILFYNSSREFVNEYNGSRIDPKGIPSHLLSKKAIIGSGVLSDIRRVTLDEAEEFEEQCQGVAEPFEYGYFFNDLKPFNHQIPIIWPRGVVQAAWVNEKTARHLIRVGEGTEPFCVANLCGSAKEIL